MHHINIGLRDLGIADPEKKVDTMAKPNYGFEKRQRELAKQKKKEEKRQHKLERAQTVEHAGEVPEEALAETSADASPETDESR